MRFFRQMTSGCRAIHCARVCSRRWILRLCPALLLSVGLAVGSVQAAPPVAVVPPTPEQTFWRWFQAHARQVATIHSGKEPIADELAQRLEEFQSGLSYEVSGPDKKGDRELVISADGIRERFPAVQRLVSAAPVIPGWRIVAFRQRHPESVKLGDRVITPKDFWIRVSNRDDGRVDLTPFAQVTSEADQTELDQALFLMLDSVLGEYDTETYVAGLDPVEPLVGDGGTVAPDLRPLTDLPAIVDALKTARADQR